MYSNVEAAAGKLLEGHQRLLTSAAEKPSLLRSGRGSAVVHSKSSLGREVSNEEIVVPKITNAMDNFVLPLQNLVKISAVKVDETTSEVHFEVSIVISNASVAQIRDEKFACSQAFAFLHKPADHPKLADQLRRHLPSLDGLIVSDFGSFTASAATTANGKLAAKVTMQLCLSQVEGSHPSLGRYGIAFGTVVDQPFPDTVRIAMTEACAGGTILTRSPPGKLRAGQSLLITVEPGCLTVQGFAPKERMDSWSLVSSEQQEASDNAEVAKKHNNEDEPVKETEEDVVTERSKRAREDEEEPEVMSPTRRRLKKKGLPKVDTLISTPFTKEQRDAYNAKIAEKRQKRQEGRFGAGEVVAKSPVPAVVDDKVSPADAPVGGIAPPKHVHFAADSSDSESSSE